MAEYEGGYDLLSYIDNLEGALRYAKKKELSQAIVKGIDEIHEGMKELDPLIQSENQEKRMKADVEEKLNELYLACKDGEGGKAMGFMRELRDRVNTLKTLFQEGRVKLVDKPLR